MTCVPEISAFVSAQLYEGVEYNFWVLGRSNCSGAPLYQTKTNPCYGS
jgi:hypothetical protein